MNSKGFVDSSRLRVGDIVTVKSDLYLGHWLNAGRTGAIVRIDSDSEQTIYHVNIDNKQYSFVRSELI